MSSKLFTNQGGNTLSNSIRDILSYYPNPKKTMHAYVDGLQIYFLCDWKMEMAMKSPKIGQILHDWKQE